MKAKVTITEYFDFTWDYYHGKYPTERLGQAFLNHILPAAPLDTALFDAGNPTNAERIIWQSYVEGVD